jgi:Colicin E5 ribonuclease domain
MGNDPINGVDPTGGFFAGLCGNALAFAIGGLTLNFSAVILKASSPIDPPKFNPPFERFAAESTNVYGPANSTSNTYPDGKGGFTNHPASGAIEGNNIDLDLLLGGYFLVRGIAGSSISVAASTSTGIGYSIFSQINPKIAKQMANRGWTKSLIHNTINNPFATRAATNRATGNAATAFFEKSGSYVVKDNVTNQVIQISNKLDSKWIPDATIINPYIPK